MQSIICILGMHRSGTSCLTGCLEDYGLHLGQVNNSAPHNTKGNKENKSSWEVNDLVLALSGGAWDEPPYQLSWNDTAKNKRASFIASYSDQETWGFKDPRCVLTLPFWLEAIPKIDLVGTFRHPLSVAKSLNKRNGFPFEKSFALWNSYNSLLIMYVKKMDFKLVNFDWDTDRYLQSVHDIATSFDLSSTKRHPQNPFFDSSLKHQSVKSNDNIAIPSESLEIYQQLYELSES